MQSTPGTRGDREMAAWTHPGGAGSRRARPAIRFPQVAHTRVPASLPRSRREAPESQLAVSVSSTRVGIAWANQYPGKEVTPAQDSSERNARTTRWKMLEPVGSLAGGARHARPADTLM